MKALIVTEPGRLTLGELSSPKPGPFEALVRIRGCGLCATTDRELIKGRQPYHKDYPAVLGHEGVGEVVELGTKVSSFKVGDLVTRPTAIWPGTKRDGLASAWGGFAEWGIVRDRLAMAAAGDASLLNDYTALRQQIVPSGLSVADAVLSISLSETSSWFRHLPPVAGKTVCIAGTGIAGLSMILWSVFAGAEKIFVIGRRAERLRLAVELGADHGLNINDGPLRPRLVALNGGRGVDFFLEAVGQRDQVQVGLSLLAPGGLVAIYGVPEKLEYAPLALGDGPGWAGVAHLPAEEHRTHRWVCGLIKRGLIPTSKLMTHHWPLASFAEAFANEREVVKGWLQID